MTSFHQVYAALRRKGIRQYLLLAGCFFLSVLLITAYISIMRSPTVLDVLPEGGDSRKQVMMIFMLTIIGCGTFCTYAAGLFFRYKSRETGIFMALGTAKSKIGRMLFREVGILTLVSCAGGLILGTPLAWMIWGLFRLFLVDTQEMPLRLDRQALWYALGFSVFVIIMIGIMMRRFIRRTNIMDVVNESRKSEPVREVSHRTGPLGIVLLIGGGLLGYLTPGFFIDVLLWYPPEWLTAFAYLPALAGLYMILLHTVVNGWRRNKGRYRHIITVSMMKFQGRQTIRNMLVIAVLVAGAYFAAFYGPMISTGAMMSYENRKVDYAFHYRSDQNLPDQEEIRRMAAEEEVTITSYIDAPVAVLGVDGQQMHEDTAALGTTYYYEYVELLTSNRFLSESAYHTLTGEAIDMISGQVATVVDDSGIETWQVSSDIHIVTNALTGRVLRVEPNDMVLRNTMLLGCHILDDGDYAEITRGLTEQWLENQVFFQVDQVADTYDFAKRLFHEIVDRSGPEVEVSSSWEPVEKILADNRGEAYWVDNENLADYGFEPIDYDQRDASHFKLNWKYMPVFRVLDKADHVKNFAIFIMTFVFIAIIAFTAVLVIAYTRSVTIAMTNARVYHDLKRLGANNGYLLKTLKGQISKVFFVPIFVGTMLIAGFYGIIMYFNDGGRFTAGEIAGMGNCLLVIVVISVLLYLFYRMTLKKVCGMMGIGI